MNPRIHFIFNECIEQNARELFINFIRCFMEIPVVPIKVCEYGHLLM